MNQTQLSPSARAVGHSRIRRGLHDLRLLPLALFAVLALAAVRADDVPATLPPERDPRSWNISAECQMVLVPQKIMLSLVASFSDDTTADAAWEKVQKMLETGEATLAADLVSKGAASQQLTSATAREMRYATEFRPPTLPDKIPEENAVEFLKAWPHVGISPEAFASRDIGESMKLSVEVSDDGKWLDVDATTEHVRFLQWLKTDAGKLANGEHLFIEQPEFHSMKDTVSLRTLSGRKSLIGVHKVPDAEKMYEMFFLRVTGTAAAK